MLAILTMAVLKATAVLTLAALAPLAIIDLFWWIRR